MVDNSVTHNGNPSIRILGGQQPFPWGEINANGIAIQPGDHIYASIWAKTQSFPSATGIAPGTFFCYDLKGYTTLVQDGSTHFGIFGPSPDTQAGHPQYDEYCVRQSIDGSGGLNQVSGLTNSIPFGTDWTLLQWDFIVPDTYYTYAWTTVSIYNVYQCVPTQAQVLLPSLGVRNNGWLQAGYVWYSEPTLYNLGQTPLPFSGTINNSPTPSPTDTPIISPSPTWGGVIIPDDTPTTTTITNGLNSSVIQSGVSFNLPLIMIISIIGAMGAIVVTSRSHRRY